MYQLFVRAESKLKRTEISFVFLNVNFKLYNDYSVNDVKSNGWVHTSSPCKERHGHALCNFPWFKVATDCDCEPKWIIKKNHVYLYVM